MPRRHVFELEPPPPKPRKDRSKYVAGAFWVVTFVLTFVLAIIAIATDHWVSWEDKDTGQESSFGLFQSSPDSNDASCDYEAVMSRTEKKFYEQFSTKLVSAFMIIGVVVDILALVAGVFYFVGKIRDKNHLWRRSIPTMVIALVAAFFILTACLIFATDMDDISERRIPAEMRYDCGTDLEDAWLGVRFAWSYFLALIAGSAIFLKALVFGLITYCC